MLTRCALALSLVVLFLTGLVGPAHATTVEDRSLRDLAIESPTVVHGIVASTNSRWTDDGSLIVTDVRFRVNTVLKGEPVREVIVTHPGGTVGKLRVDVSGATAYQPGEEVVLFLRPSDSGRSVVTGLFLGRFDVTRDPEGRKVVRGMSGPDRDTIQSATSSSGAVPLSAVPGASVPLDQFLGEIRGLIDEIKLEGGR